MTLHLDRPVPPETSVTDVLPPARDQLRHALENDRRRMVLRSILEANEPITVGALAGQLADDESDPTLVTTLLERRQRVYVTLRRTHLPLLESCSLVVYDRERGVVSPGRELSTLESLLAGEETPLESAKESTTR
ncbi:DUF7344 domain-containing protein [Natronobacterium gregoryi]|uniref:DUF7344 domain-containing protein n=2 Tax=Natronobacterium gregoryi TaxID=44930 RepID=L0AGE3_NATGS|nr:hypothetical protein [Natronobacterium gregoryi]AFZ72988.1 hypothetical protein Natgr_1796 [Natronobacterium gregoryi SP2]ELY70077.1 hypothetical protein C490_06924 [Natronobacterium gregoryi SP2]PLK19087.1 hypothetical protein CYV19_16760 [Natronobacterium gregoryi SP2]